MSLLRQEFILNQKMEDNEPVFRPLHSANIIDQISIVAMLNVLIYEIPGDDYKLHMSNYSRLIPSNFYGNRVSLNPKELFKPWSRQYKEYTELANDYLKTYYNTGEFAYEVDLDLENYFPSVNPIILYNYFMSKVPAYLNLKEKELLKTILIKLLVCKNTNLDNDITRKLYYKEQYCGKDDFTLGIPQGLPQSYFMGNICMIELSKIFNEQFSGKSLYYVDDSVIFTNDVEEDKFEEKIDLINDKIKEKCIEYLKLDYDNDFFRTYNESLWFFGFETEYQIRVHGLDGKSSYTNILNLNDSDIYLKCLGREASQVGGDMMLSYSDDEDIILENKLNILCKAIERKQSDIAESLSKEISDLKKVKLENEKDQLIRYNKYFRYRKLKLSLRKSNDLKEMQEILNISNEINISEFLNVYKNNIWDIAFQLYYSNQLDEDKISKLVEYLNAINSNLFGFNNTQSSYIYQNYTYMKQRNNTKSLQPVDKYYSLERLVKLKLRFLECKHDNLIKEYLVSIKKMEATKLSKQLKLFSDSFINAISIVSNNTDELIRMILNAIYSYVFNIELSDSFEVCKKGRRPLQYNEVREILFLRNIHFSLQKYERLDINYNEIGDGNKLDYGLLEVLDCFKCFVKEPELIDNLIQIHKYTCDVWKNGSKYLYFYTLHNQEHAIDLIKNIIKIIKAFDYLKIKSNDYYILFVACYLHDISMVKIPKLQYFLLNEHEADDIVDEFVEDTKKMVTENNNQIKRLLAKYYKKVDQFFENEIRSKHAHDSAGEIRNRNDINYLDDCLREIIAEVAEAHGSNIEDIYNIKSDATNKKISLKFDKILLRLADLLDMKSYRISQPILEHNIEEMTTLSAFHWISHMLTSDYRIENYYEIIDEALLTPKSIKETIVFVISVDLSQMSVIEKSSDCRNVGLESETLSDKGFELRFGENCKCDRCNFLCKWFNKKNEYLIQELSALKKYLNRCPDNFYINDIVIRIQVSQRTHLNEKQFEIIKSRL